MKENKSEYTCSHYDTYSDGREFCHNTDPTVVWWKVDENGKLNCKGNPHICKKLMYKWLASLKREK